MATRLPTPVFSIGDTVYQRVATEMAGIVTGLIFRPGGSVIYLVTWPVEHCSDETNHWDFELTSEKGFGA